MMLLVIEGKLNSRKLTSVTTSTESATLNPKHQLYEERQHRSLHLTDINAQSLVYLNKTALLLGICPFQDINVRLRSML
jgi:hypothetical protein